MANTKIFGHLLDELNDGVTVFREGVGKPMPLTKTDIDIHVTAGLALIVTTRLFSNAEDVPIEAILTMPVGFNAVVTGLTARIDGRELRASAKAKDEARDSYEDAIDQGKTSILHEEALRGIHILSVGQLAPGKEVEVELRMVMPLSLSDGGPFFRLPMTTGQLYGASPLQPADDLITDAAFRHDATVTIRTDAGMPQLLGHGPITAAASVKVPLDKAIEFVVQGGRFGTVTGVSAAGYRVRIDLRQQQVTESNLKLAILVDRSGSTSSLVSSGPETVLSAIRAGLADALSCLTDNDHVAIWQFSDDCQRLGTGRGTEVLEILKKLNQPGGGTRLGTAIRKVAASGIHDILVLTDGQTWETLPELATELNIRISAVLVGKDSLDANIGHLCAFTGGELFYVPDADVGASVRLALNSKRSTIALRQIELTNGRPSIVKNGFGGVEIAASWSDAIEVGAPRDFGRFAAWLCLAQMDAEEAKALALEEGLCTQATSLVLVDQAGETSTGLSETRKVPLMTASTTPSTTLSAPSEPQVRMMMREPPSSNRERRIAGAPSREAIKRHRMARANQPSMTLAQSIQFLRDEIEREAAFGPLVDLDELAVVAEGIDWDQNVNRFLSTDFTGLLEDERIMLEELLETKKIAVILEGVKLSHKLVLLAWLAGRFVNHSRAAHRFAVKVLSQISGRDIALEIDNLITDFSGKDN